MTSNFGADLTMPTGYDDSMWYDGNVDPGTCRISNIDKIPATKM
jgi:hypothetical protein